MAKEMNNNEILPVDELQMCSSEIEDAVSKNDEEWQKRMLLLVMTMIIALLGLD